MGRVNADFYCEQSGFIGIFLKERDRPSLSYGAAGNLKPRAMAPSPKGSRIGVEFSYIVFVAITIGRRMNFQKSAPMQQRVLIVDDDPVVVKAIAANLNRAGYQTLEASGGAEAIALAGKEMPDLMVLDLNFPPDRDGVAWDGYRIMTHLRRMKETRTIPVITITGFPDSLDMERNLDLGALGFLYKPLDYDELLRLVRNALGAAVTLAA